MSTSSTVSLNDVNTELCRSSSSSINMNEPEVRFFANQTLSTISTQTFTSTTTWTCPTGVTSVEYLIIAGGASGGKGQSSWGQGGGGGAGGMLRGTYTTTPGTTYNVTIGGGGAAPTSGGRGSNGSNSSIFGIVAIGGGAGGGTDNSSNYSGNTGGCGGGSSFPVSGGTGTAFQGRNGGTGTDSASSPQYGGGGGGGTGDVGASGSNIGGGNGGIGRISSISGSVITYAGGGGGTSVSSANVGIGGAGGGGNGASDTTNGTSGTANSGGGGGGGSANYAAGSGGSGIIILRWYVPSSNSGTGIDMNAMRSLSPPFAGTNYGYTAGGGVPSGNRTSAIERISFSTDGNSTSVGNLSSARGSNNGHQNEVYGWASNGLFNPPANPPTAYTSIIERFPFSSVSTVSTVANLDKKRTRGVGTSSRTAGYAISGNINTVETPPPAVAATSEIERFSFANESNQCTIGNLTNIIQGGSAGFGTLAYGYNAGGVREPAASGSYANIERFPFAFDSVSMTSVGSLTLDKGLTNGASSPTHGYSTGGLQTPTLRYTTIDRFSFFSINNATNVGDMTANLSSMGTISSLNNGYICGGATSTQYGPPGVFVAVDTIQKFPFSAPTTATNIGVLLSDRIQVATISD